MNYKADIVVAGDCERLYNCLVPEKDDVNAVRSSLDFVKEEGHIRIRITAKDAVALRTCMNSAARLLVVYEKIKNLKNGKQGN